MSLRVKTIMILLSVFVLYGTLTYLVQQEIVFPSFVSLEQNETKKSNAVSAVDTFAKLKELGVQLAIDDFGTGYSSTSRLKHFPIDRLKIDSSFVREVDTNSKDAAIASAVIAMADNMRLNAVAEGVETKGQLEFLRGKSCDEIQGFYLCQPLPADAITDFLRQHDRGQAVDPLIGEVGQA